MELCYTVPLEAEGQRLGLFLRTCGVTAGLIKSVKHKGKRFLCRRYPAAYKSAGSCRATHYFCSASGTAYQCGAATYPDFHCL